VIHRQPFAAGDPDHQWIHLDQADVKQMTDVAARMAGVKRGKYRRRDGVHCTNTAQPVLSSPTNAAP
jgi:hypothetical protein